MYVYIYIYIQTYIHTYIHMYVYRSRSGLGRRLPGHSEAGRGGRLHSGNNGSTKNSSNDSSNDM